ncbi:hypothetical protein RDWZM_001376, partial [Blomia tropicalis]
MLPYCEIINNNGSITVLYSLETELLKIVENKFRFHSKLIDAEQKWGSKTNGTWNGIVGLIYKRVADIGLCGISNTPDRADEIDFTYNTAFEELTFFSQSPKLMSKDLLLVMPFDTIVWLCNIGSFALITFIAYRITLFHRSITSSTKSVHLLIDMFGSTMGQSIKMDLKEIAQVRLLYIIWLFVMVVIETIYCGQYYSIMTVPEYDRAIDTLQDIERIAKKDHGYLLTAAHSSYLDSFLKATPEDGILYEIGQHMIRTNQVMHDTDIEATNSIEESRHTIMISNRLTLAINRRVYATKALHIGTDTLAMDYIAFIMAKKSHLTKPFNR